MTSRRYWFARYAFRLPFFLISILRDDEENWMKIKRDLKEKERKEKKRNPSYLTTDEKKNAREEKAQQIKIIIKNFCLERNSEKIKKITERNVISFNHRWTKDGYKISLVTITRKKKLYYTRRRYSKASSFRFDKQLPRSFSIDATSVAAAKLGTGTPGGPSQLVNSSPRMHRLPEIKEETACLVKVNAQGPEVWLVGSLDGGRILGNLAGELVH